MKAVSPLWEKLVRRAYPAQQLAQTLCQDVAEIGRWCASGVPHGYRAIVASVLEQVPERVFLNHSYLPTGREVVAVCDGGECTERVWMEQRGAALKLPQALHLDQLGYGVLMHRPIKAKKGRWFALEFRLLPGVVSGLAVSRLAG